MTLWNQIRQQQAALTWEGSFAEYYELVKARPGLAQRAHARIYAAIRHFGTRPGRLGETNYNLFAGELFGLERTLGQVEQYFASAARGLDTRKRILLLVGPPGSGKTTFANLLKQGLEQFSRTDEGALYAIAGCPIQEEPLHLIPPEFRPEVEQELGLSIEGELCPHCRWLLRETYEGKVEEVRVRRVLLSEAAGIGIGTFVATDPRSQDITRLIGSFDHAQLGDDRLLPSGRAYHLDGELNVANRGLVEFIEIFKLEERFLAMLLVLTEEHKIKAPGFGSLYVDEAIVAHTNEAEYRATTEDPRSEALQDRLVVVRFPYNLRVSDEIRIYRKLLRGIDLAEVHLSPLALPVAATLAVLSRLSPPRKWGMSLPLKLSLYDGRYEPGYTRQDVEDLLAESPQEGMTGISPRFVINQIANAIGKTDGCLDPLDLLQTLWEGIEQSTTLARVEQERLFDLFKEARREYERLAVRAVQMAIVEDFPGRAEALWRGYLADAEAFTTAEPAVDEEAMRRLERQVHLDGEQAQTFRREVVERYQTWQAQGMPLDYTFEPRLAGAIEAHLLPPQREVSHLVVPPEKLDPEKLKQRTDVLRRLVEEHGFEPDCAESLLDYVAEVLGVSGKRRTLSKVLKKWMTG